MNKINFVGGLFLILVFFGIIIFFHFYFQKTINAEMVFCNDKGFDGPTSYALNQFVFEYNSNPGVYKIKCFKDDVEGIKTKEFNVTKKFGLFYEVEGKV